MPGERIRRRDIKVVPRPILTPRNGLAPSIGRPGCVDQKGYTVDFVLRGRLSLPSYPILPIHT